MLTRPVLERLAALRLTDAQLLHESVRYSSAYYLSGYAVELALKACIAKQFVQETIPERELVNAIYTHDLESLLTTAPLKDALRVASARDHRLALNWNAASRWTESSRYAVWEEASSAEMLSAIGESITEYFNGCSDTGRQLF
jgi:HEPN domain-containing protein